MSLSRAHELYAEAAEMFGDGHYSEAILNVELA